MCKCFLRIANYWPNARCTYQDLYKDRTFRLCLFCEGPRKDSSICNGECLVARWARLVSELGLCLLNRYVGGLCLVERKGKEGGFVFVDSCRDMYQFLLPMPAYCSIHN